jgi:hypothetical protein
LSFVVGGVEEEVISGDAKHLTELLGLLVGSFDEILAFLGFGEGVDHGSAAMDFDGTGGLGSQEQNVPGFGQEAADEKDLDAGCIPGFGVCGAVEVQLGRRP